MSTATRFCMTTRLGRAQIQCRGALVKQKHLYNHVLGRAVLCGKFRLDWTTLRHYMEKSAAFPSIPHEALP